MMALCLAFAGACTGNIEDPMTEPDPEPDPDPDLPDPEDLYPTFLLEPDAASEQPGVRRLTRSELQRTILDLTGVDADVSALLEDREILNLQNDARRSTVSEPGHVLSYLELATEVAGDADIDAVLPCAAACTDAELHVFLDRAFNEAVPEADFGAYRDTYTRARGELSEENARRAIVLTALLSPKLLYRTEVGEGEGTLTATELAEKLSYFVWGRGPDAALRARALDGTILEPATLAEELDRMLAHEWARERVAEFCFDWLGLDHLSLDAKLAYDELPEGIAHSMEEEAARMIARVIFDEGEGLRALLTTDRTEVDADLAAHYGLAFSGEGWQEVSLAETERRGLLTTALVLAAHAKESGRSPMQRGNFLIAEVMSLGFPPEFGAAAMTLPDDVEDLTFREQFAPLETLDTCSNCHRMLNAGFAFDLYDAVGRRFPSDRVLPEETEAVFDAPPYDPVSFATTAEAVEGLSRHPVLVRSFVGQVLHFAQGSAPSELDATLAEALEEDFDNTDGDVLALIRDIVLSERFVAVVRAAEGS